MTIIASGARPARAQWPDLLSQFPDAPSRRAVLDELAWVAIGFDLHRWRRAVRGNLAAEADLLRLLRASDIGDGTDLDASLAALPAPPDDLSKREVLDGIGEAADARAVARWRTLLGGVSPSIPASPVADFPIIIEAPGDDGVSIGELAQLLVADARREATQRLDPAGRADCVRRLATADLLTRDGDPELLALGIERFADTDDVAWARQRPHFVAWQRGVIGSALLSLPTPPGPTADWRAWVDRPPPKPSRRRRMPLRLIVSALAIVAFICLPLLPKAPPGELAPRRLTAAVTSCAGCPAARRVVGAGLLSDAGRIVLTLRYGAAPAGDAVDVTFPDGREVVIGRPTGKSGWGVASASAVPVPTSTLRDIQIARQGEDLVVSMPPSLAGRGASLTDGLVRVPASGTLPVRHLPSPGLNIVDVVLAAWMAFALRRGYRRGLSGTLPALGGFLLTLLASRVLYQPLGRAVAHLWPASVTANAVALGLLISVIGLGVSMVLYSLGGRIAAPFARWLGEHTPVRTGQPADGWLGVPVTLVRSVLIGAGILVLVSDLLVFSYARSWTDTSVLGRAFTAMWRSVYPGT